MDSTHNMHMLDREKINILNEMKQESLRVCHVTQNSMQLKTLELFIYGSFHLIFPLIIDIDN